VVPCSSPGSGKSRTSRVRKSGSASG
jgi:hypothetical protein